MPICCNINFAQPPPPNFYTSYDDRIFVIKVFHNLLTALLFKHLLKGCMHIAHSCIPPTAK